jgi:hypothetical protein
LPPRLMKKVSGRPVTPPASGHSVRTVTEVRIRDAVPPDERPRVGRDVELVQPDECDAAISRREPSPLKPRRLGSAGRAPRRPEVEYHGVALQLRQRNAPILKHRRERLRQPTAQGSSLQNGESEGRRGRRLPASEVVVDPGARRFRHHPECEQGDQPRDQARGCDPACQAHGYSGWLMRSGPLPRCCAMNARRASSTESLIRGQPRT